MQLKAYKLTSLGLIVQAEEATTVALHDIECHGSVNLVNSNIWTPNIPDSSKVLAIPGKYQSQAALPRPFNPLFNMDFGGENGQLLKDLIRVVAHMVYESRPIIGLEFVYVGGNSKLFGIGGEAEMSFVLDGPSGERIIELTVVEADGIQGLEVRVLVIKNYRIRWPDDLHAYRLSRIVDTVSGLAQRSCNLISKIRRSHDLAHRACTTWETLSK